jgi:uncharacterized membrane protein
MGADSRRDADGASSVRAFSADLVVVLLLTLLTLVSVFAPVVRETPLRVVVGLPFVFFIPGYVLMAAIFPEAHPESRGEEPISPTVLYPEEVRSKDAEDDPDLGGITIVERVGLSFATSIVVVAIVGLVLNNTPFGIQLVSVVGANSAVVIGLLVVAVRRRLAIPAEVRFRVPWRAKLAGLYAELFSPASRTDALLNVTLAFALLVAATSVGYAIVVPTEGQSYTELYLLTEQDGELVAEGYPTEFTAGEPRPLVVGVGNREHEAVTYTVLVEMHRVRLGNDSTQVLETERLDRFRQRLSSNETWHHRHSVAPTMVGEPLRLTYLLYRGSPPPEPTVDNAYRDLHLWVNVTAG